MNKQKWNYFVDALALLAFIAVSASGVFIKIFMPGGVRQGRLQEFLGVQKGTWSEIHDWSGIFFIILVSIHLILHWDWISCMTKNMFRFGNCESKAGEKEEKQGFET